MAAHYQEVRCRGCRRLLGLAKNDFTIYCDVSCIEDFPAAASEARDAILEAVWLTRKPTLQRLGEMFGFSLQRAHQIVKKRDIRKAVITNR